MDNKFIPYKQLKSLMDKEPIVKAVAEDRINWINMMSHCWEKMFGKLTVEKKSKGK